MSIESDAVSFFTDRLRRAGSAARANGEKAYLKSDLRFWGTGLQPIRAAVREYCDSHPDPTRAGLRAIAEALYATYVHELRASAIGILERNRETLVDRDLPWLITLVRESESWAYVDWIAPKVIGDVIARDARSRKRLAVWAKDDDFWVRRASLLAEHDALRSGGGDFALWSRLAPPMLEEREFFIRKAIGWVLREVSKKRPELAYEFLRGHRDRVSSLSLREGAKYLPAPKRKALVCPADAKTGRARRMQPAEPWHGSVGRSGAGTVATSRLRSPVFARTAWSVYRWAGGSRLSRSSRSPDCLRSRWPWLPPNRDRSRSDRLAAGLARALLLRRRSP